MPEVTYSLFRVTAPGQQAVEPIIKPQVRIIDEKNGRVLEGIEHKLVPVIIDFSIGNVPDSIVKWFQAINSYINEVIDPRLRLQNIDSAYRLLLAPYNANEVKTQAVVATEIYTARFLAENLLAYLESDHDLKSKVYIRNSKQDNEEVINVSGLIIPFNDYILIATMETEGTGSHIVPFGRRDNRIREDILNSELIRSVLGQSPTIDPTCDALNRIYESASTHPEVKNHFRAILSFCVTNFIAVNATIPTRARVVGIR